MLDIAKTIWDVGKGLFGMRAELQKAERARRDRVAEYFTDLGSLIEATSASLKARQYPHGSCAQLAQLAELMPETLKGLLDDQEVLEYRKKLLSVWQIERLHAELQPVPDSALPAELAPLDEAAGFFRAIAAHLRVAGP